MEWENEDSQEEDFILVESKKAKKEKKKRLKEKAKSSPRRSKRTAPSIYRNKGQQEIPKPSISDKTTNIKK